MSKWRLADSLVTLRDEINTMFPERSKVSDGAKGDTAHAKRLSDHNPNAAGVVCAIDVTHDTKEGADMQIIADYMRTHPHPNLDCLIFAGHIATRHSKFLWLEYKGKNKHHKHMHVSVGFPWGKLGQATSKYDDETEWLEGYMSAPEKEKLMTTKLFVNGTEIKEIKMIEGNMFVRVTSLVKPLKGVLTWDEKTKTAKMTVRSGK